MATSQEPQVKVWDPFVRFFHWSLAVAFLLAYFLEPEEGTLAVHVWAGYAVGGLVLLRVVWGFIGSKHARFSDFLFSPFTALRYLGGLFRGRSKRYLGHSPAGAWMVFSLLAALLVTVFLGMGLYAQGQNRGPLAPFFGAMAGVSLVAAPAYADEDEGGDVGERTEGATDLFEELHEVAANVTLILALLHIGGVVLASLAHHENLARAMVTGRKRPD